MEWQRIIFISISVFYMTSCSTVGSTVLEPGQHVGQQQIETPLTRGKIRLLSVVRLPRARLDGLDMVELSGLAWSEDENMLYALSDHGNVFRVRPGFRSGMLSGVELISAFSLKDLAGEPRVWPWHDSEGLVVVGAHNGNIGDEQLVVSFERRPRIEKYTSKGGWKEQVPLPDSLADRTNYERSNHGLEAVAVHPHYGVLTVPEQVLSDAPQDNVLIYATSGKQWKLPHSVDSKLSVVALEVMPDGALLMLQRDLRVFGIYWTSVLTRVLLYENGGVTSDKLVELNSSDEILPMDNFEGLAHHMGNRYFMVSDGNEHPLQDTLLVYFEVLD